MPDTIPYLNAGALGYIPLVNVPDVQPFTIRSGATFDSILESMRTWIRDELVPYMLANNAQTVYDQNIAIILNAIRNAFAQQVPIADGVVAAILALSSSATKTALDGRYVIHAPAPSGGDDTVAIQTLLTAAMSTSGVGFGVVQLQHGQYKISGLVMNGGFFQARLQGKGKQATTLKSTDPSKPIVQVVGGSGSITSGLIADLTVLGYDATVPTGRQGRGIELVGCGGVHVERVQFSNLDKGLRFYNRDPGMFTEFCVARDCNWNYVRQPVEYAKEGSATESSFHGSGVEGNSVAGLAAGDSFMEIQQGCFVYFSPLTVTIFMTAGPGNLIVNRNTNRPAAVFHGVLKIEYQNTGTSDYTIAWPGGANVYLAGELLALNGPIRLGKRWLIDKMNFTGTGYTVHVKPWNHRQVLAAGTFPVMGDPPVQGPGSYLCNVSVIGPGGYWYAYTLLVWSSGTSVPPVITVLANPVATNPTNGPGAPVFSFDGQLKVTNPNYTTSYSSIGDFIQLASANNNDNLGQY